MSSFSIERTSGRNKHEIKKLIEYLEGSMRNLSGDLSSYRTMEKIISSYKSQIDENEINDIKFTITSSMGLDDTDDEIELLGKETFTISF